MKKLKAFTLIFLVFAFVWVAACSNDSPPINTAEPGKVAEPSKKPGGKVEAVETEKPALDMKGEPIKILLWAGEPEEGTQEGDLMLARQKEVEAKYNTTVEWVKVPWGESIKMVTAAGLSGEPVADIILFDLYHAIPLINKGLLRPVDDLFDFDDPKWPKNIKQYGSFNGEMYGFREMVIAGSGVYYNKTLFKREGLPDPHQLIKEDKWNWDALLDIAKKATKDTDGDGVIDQWGITNLATTLARILIYSNDGTIVDQRDGKWVYSANDPNTIEALHFLNELYNTHKVIAPNTKNDDYNNSQKLFNSGKAAIVTGEEWEGAERRDMTDEFGFVYFPKGPKAQDYVSTIENFTMWYMPANAKRPKEAAQIWEELILWERIDHRKREAAEKQLLAAPEDVDLLVQLGDRVKPLFLPTGGAFGDTVWSILLEGESPETAIEKRMQTGQAAVDQNYNQSS